MSTRIDAGVFANRWISKWNRKDVEGVLSEFSEGVVFTSPRAKAIVGSSRVEGKSSLRNYWTKAIDRIQTIHFSLDYVIGEGDRLSIIYIAEVDGRRMRCVEFMVFGDDGLVREGEAMHGIEL